MLPLLTQPETIGRAVAAVGNRLGAGGGGGDCFDALAAALLEPSALPALQDSESQRNRDLATELREHSDAVPSGSATRWITPRGNGKFSNPIP